MNLAIQPKLGLTAAVSLAMLALLCSGPLNAQAVSNDQPAATVGSNPQDVRPYLGNDRDEYVAWLLQARTTDLTGREKEKSAALGQLKSGVGVLVPHQAAPAADAAARHSATEEARVADPQDDQGQGGRIEDPGPTARRNALDGQQVDPTGRERRQGGSLSAEGGVIVDYGPRRHYLGNDMRSRMVDASTNGQQGGLGDWQGPGNLEDAGAANGFGVPASGRIESIPYAGEEEYLFASENTLSVNSGGRIDFLLDFPVSEAGLRYAMLASTSGDVLANEFIDPLLARTLRGDWPRGVSGARGFLDAQGDGEATIDLQGGISGARIGMQVSIWAVTLEPGSHAVSLSSRPVTVTFVP